MNSGYENDKMVNRAKAEWASPSLQVSSVKEVTGGMMGAFVDMMGGGMMMAGMGTS